MLQSKGLQRVGHDLETEQQNSRQMKSMRVVELFQKQQVSCPSSGLLEWGYDGKFISVSRSGLHP